MNQLTPHWYMQAKILKHCSLSREFGPEGLGTFCSTFSSISWGHAGDVSKAPQLLAFCHAWMSKSWCVSTQTPWVTHWEPAGTLCWQEDLPGEHTGTEIQWSGFQVTATTAPNERSRKCPQNAIPSPPAWLTPNGTNPCQWSRSHRGKRKQTTATVVTITSWCHLAQLLRDKLGSSQLHTSSKQHVLLPNREQKARVYFKQAIKTNTIVWNTLSCPHKYCLCSGLQRVTVFHSLLAHRTQLPVT